MAIRDYLLSQLQARQSLAAQEYQRRQLELQLERERAAREQQRNLAIMKQVGQLADVGLKGVGMAAGALEAQQAKDTAARLAEAQARAELAGLEEYSPEELQIQEELPGTLKELPGMLKSAGPKQPLPTAGLGIPTFDIEEKLASLQAPSISAIEERPLKTRQIDLSSLGVLQPEPTVVESPVEPTFEAPPGSEIISFEDQPMIIEGSPTEPEEPAPEPAEEPAPEPEEPAIPAEAKRQEEAVDKALDKVEKQTGYAVRRFKKTPNELADQIVNEVYAKKPSGNPILDFFTGDPQKIETEKLLAKAAVVRQIKQARANLLESDYDRFMKEKGMQLEEQKVEVARIAKEAALARATKGQELRIKQNMSGGIRQSLDSFDVSQRSLKDLRNYTRKLLESGEGIPAGPVRTQLLAAIEQHAAETGGAGISVNASALGTGGGISLNRSGKPIDEELIKRAFNRIDKSKLTPNQQLFISQVFRTIQNLGKQLEGGKLTDADYEKYVDNLFNLENPKTFLMSLNQNSQNLYDQYSKSVQSLRGENYAEEILAPYEPEEPDLFTDEEIEGAFEAGVSPKALAVARKGATFERNLVGVELQTFLNIMKKIKDGTATQEEISEAEEIARKAVAAAGESDDPELADY